MKWWFETEASCRFRVEEMHHNGDSRFQRVPAVVSHTVDSIGYPSVQDTLLQVVLRHGLVVPSRRGVAEKGK